MNFLFMKLKQVYKDRFCLVFYDALIGDTLKEVERIFKFCNLEVQSQTIQFLNDSKSSEKKSAYSVFRNKKQDVEWKDLLTETIFSEIKDDIIENKITEFKYDK